MKDRIERLKKISDELFTLANSFAGEKTGTAAGEIHKSCGTLSNAVRMLENGITLEDKRKQMLDWLREKSWNKGRSDAELQAMVNMVEK